MEFDAARKRHLETLVELQKTKLDLEALVEDLKAAVSENEKLEITIEETRAAFKENNQNLLLELENTRAERDKEREDRMRAHFVLNYLKTTPIVKIREATLKVLDDLKFSSRPL